MSIGVQFIEAEEEVLFDCPNTTCKMRNELMSNLENFEIPYEDNGSQIFVALDQFDSCRDIESKALKGFTEEYNDLASFQSDNTRFSYRPVVPAASDAELRVLFKKQETSGNKTAQDFKSKLKALEVSGKKLIEQYFNQKSSLVMNY